MRSTPPRALSVLALVVLAVLPSAAQAQIDSTTKLKQACEAGTHHIYVTTDVKINKGPHQNVAGGCQITLGPAASFEAERVSMAFSGPFRMDAARERSISFTDSAWKASTLELYGDAGSFRNVASLLQATVGDVRIMFGSQSTIALQQRPAGSVNAVKAAGLVSLAGGETVSLELANTAIEGRQGIQVSLGGTDSALKAEHAELRSPRGFVSVSSPAPKALVELKDVTLAAGRGNATVRLASESQLKTAFTRISSQGGSVDLQSGNQYGRFGGIELVETNVSATHGVRVQGSPSADRGTVKVAASTFSGGSDIVFRTGALGQTEVKDSAISSASAIRILTGAGGTCTEQSNTYQSPVRQICP